MLEIHPDASLEVMNNAYRALVRKCHPDLFHTHHKDSMNARMAEINEAYNILSNPHSRKEYDIRYQEWRQKIPRADQAPKTARKTLFRMLRWGLGTYLALSLLRPLLGSPLGKLILLAICIALFFRLYAGRKRS